MQASAVSPIRRPVPIPGTLESQPARGMSSSVFNLNQNGYQQQQPQFAQPNPWGMNSMGQVSKINVIAIYVGNLSII